MDALDPARKQPDTICTACGGSGFCARCAGNGRYLVRGMDVWANCFDCAGSGECSECDGTGQVERNGPSGWQPFDVE
jgi:hypothetical protein